MIRILKNLIIFYCLFIFSTSYSQTQNENSSIFKLATTPFIHKSDLALGFSYGINYGIPSQYLQQWFLPDERKNILYNYSEARLSFLNRFSFFVGYSKIYRAAYNNPPNVNYSDDGNYMFGLKWKLLEANGYYPAFSVEINNIYNISLSVGSTEERFKYYLTTYFLLYYIIPVPTTSISSGISFEILQNVNLFLEGKYNHTKGGTPYNTSIRSGINYSPFSFLNFDVGLFYFHFDYEHTIPGGIAELPRKDQYYLLSGGITLDFSLLNN